MLVHAEQPEEHYRDREQDGPRALLELHRSDDDRHQAAHDPAETVEEQADAPTLFLLDQVVLRHAQLREGERGEHTDRVQGNQVGDARLENDDDDARQGRQDDDAVREHQPVAVAGQLAWQEGVAGVEAGKPREIGEACVRRQHQDEKCCDLESAEQEQTEPVRTENTFAGLSKHADLLGQVDAYMHMRRQHRQAEEHHAERRPHPHERRACVLPLGLLERRHAVGDRFDTCDCGATGRERLQDDPDGKQTGHRWHLGDREL